MKIINQPSGFILLNSNESIVVHFVRVTVKCNTNIGNLAALLENGVLEC